MPPADELEQSQGILRTGSANMWPRNYAWRLLGSVDRHVSHLASKINFFTQDMTQMMTSSRQLKKLGLSEIEASRKVGCQWIKKNQLRWKAWIPVLCPPGQYSESMSSCLNCPPGSVCQGGMAEREACPQGFYCPANSSRPSPCPAGYTTGLDGYGAVSAEQCDECVAGRSSVMGTCVPLGVLLAAVVAPSIVVVLIAVAIALKCGTAMQEVEEERELNSKITELRRLLRITRSDGYLLSSERPGWFTWGWKRTPIWIPRAHMEAAARLGLLLEDVDGKALDGFCNSLSGGHSWMPLKRWLLDTATILLDPHDIDDTTAPTVGDGLREVDGFDTAPLSPFVAAASSTNKGLAISAAGSHLDNLPRPSQWLMRADPTGAVECAPRDRQRKDAVEPASVPRRSRSGESRPSRISEAVSRPFSSEFARRSRGSDCPRRLRGEFRGGGLGGNSGVLGGVQWASQERRFEYFRSTLGQLQIWKERDGEMFEELKQVVRDFMCDVGAWCAERFRQLALQPLGTQLTGYASCNSLGNLYSEVEGSVDVPNQEVPGLGLTNHDGAETGRKFSCSGDHQFFPDADSFSSFRDRTGGSGIKRTIAHAEYKRHTLRGTSSLFNRTEAFLCRSFDEVYTRQDHQEVGAIRVSHADREEAALQGGFGDEEVFLSQLHLRSRLLNDEFYRKVQEVVLRHALQTGGFPAVQTDPTTPLAQAIDRTENESHDKNQSELRVTCGQGNHGLTTVDVNVKLEDSMGGPATPNSQPLTPSPGFSRQSGVGPIPPLRPRIISANESMRGYLRSMGSEIASAHGSDVTDCGLECWFRNRTACLKVYPAAHKTLSRMREKLRKYAPPHPRGIWPLCANILDPIRASVVVSGGADSIMEVLKWFAEHEEENGLLIRRVKNKFSRPEEEIIDGYRDVQLSLLFTGSRGLRIIGELQIHDLELYRLKLKMHKLYKVARAAALDSI